MPEKQYFIGIDSDGTAFDSMSPKHYDAFIPAAIDIWNLQEHADKVTEIGARINLYSKHRGVNRFPGLVIMFDELKELGIDVGDYSSLVNYVNSSKVYSNASLEEYMSKNPDPFLDKVMKWSRDADVIFAKKVEGMPPFDGVAKSLEKVSKIADVVVVSSASAKGLVKDWNAGGIDIYTHAIMGQENGTKEQQLKTAIADKYPRENTLMIGDALGDYKAAQSAGALFYPIMPGDELKSWKEFYDVASDKFFDGTFAGEYQENILKDFLKLLS